MSDEVRNVSAILLFIVGVVFIGMLVVIFGFSGWCLYNAVELQGTKFGDKCSDGTIKEGIFALIGAVGALWGAYWVKSK